MSALTPESAAGQPIGSPLASSAATLIALGYSAIPISPADKMPGNFAGGEWRPMKGWSRYCGTLAGPFEVRMWSGWPDANIGVACGRGVLAFDIDRDDLVAPIKAVLPPAIVGKRGRKGETLFFRGDTDAIRSRGFKIDKAGVLDLISDGKQTVIPPSIHPDTGAPYTWTTERTLLDTPPAELNEVTTEHVEAVIEVLRAHGYQAPEVIRPTSADGVVLGEAAEDVSAWFRKLNEDALANLDSWVPRLGLTRLVHSGDGYRSVAEWRPSGDGKPIGARRLLLAIDPKGIVDYGDGDKGYTPLNLVMAALDIGDGHLEKAAVWLGEAIGYNFAPRMVLNRKRKARDPKEEAARLYKLAQEAECAPVAVVVLPEPPHTVTNNPSAMQAAIEAAPNVVEFDVALSADADLGERPVPETLGDRLADLCAGVNGIVGDLVDWMRATASTPNDVLAFAASIAFVGALAGRNYKAEYKGARTNLYTLGLARSAFGKDHARQCIKHIVTKGGLGKFVGASKIMSASALRNRVQQQPAIFYPLDEFGGFMRDINNAKMPHMNQCRELLLEYFSSASTYFGGADYAGEQGVVCHNPNVCLYGTSTPADFWGACRSLSVADGLLARILIFPVGGKRPAEIEPASDERDPPASLVKGLQRLTVSKVGGNLNNVLADGTTSCRAMSVRWADSAAKDMFFGIKREFSSRADERGEGEESIWGRTAEHALKLALVIEIGVDPDRPIIHAQTLTLARDIVETSTLMTIAEIAGRLADNDRQREHIDVRRWILDAGLEGITRTDLSRRINGRFDRRRLEDILSSLEHDSREIVRVKAQPSGPGRPSERFTSSVALAAEFG